MFPWTKIIVLDLFFIIFRMAESVYHETVSFLRYEEKFRKMTIFRRRNFLRLNFLNDN